MASTLPLWLYGAIAGGVLFVLMAGFIVIKSYRAIRQDLGDADGERAGPAESPWSRSVQRGPLFPLQWTLAILCPA